MITQFQLFMPFLGKPCFGDSSSVWLSINRTALIGTPGVFDKERLLV